MVAIDETHFKIITAPEVDMNKNGTTDSTLLKIDGKQASGTASIDLHGYPSWDLQTMMMYYKNEEMDKMARAVNLRGSNKYVQKSYQFTKSDTGYKDSRLTSVFVIDDYVQKVDKEYYVNLNVNRYFEKNNIDTQQRNVPVYFKYKDLLREVVVLDIPAGYHVSYLPPAASGALKGKWEYDIRYSEVGKKVLLTKEYRMLAMSVPPEDFMAHNKMVDNLNKQYKESVVLTAD